jgi:hypothetical protein
MADVSKNDVSAMLSMLASASNLTFGKKTLVLDGKDWTGVELNQTLQGQIAKLQVSTAAHATCLKTVADHRSEDSTVIVPLVKALRAYVALLYGTNSQTYLDFGFAPPQKAKPSTETRSAALAQSRATRKARNTMGKKQRLAITGVVSPVTAVPAATSPSQPNTTTANVAAPSEPNGANGQSH